jgi:hypothetical protein
MAITILDLVKARVGDKDTYPAEDFYRNGVDMLGGCETCGAAIGPWNAYPSTTGYWQCADCIGDQGYDTTAAFEAATGLGELTDVCQRADQQQTDLVDADEIYGLGVLCPSCRDAAHVIEIRFNVFECGDCGATWSA